MSDQPHVLELLELHETAIKDMYEVFAEQFPSHAALWTAIAAEEVGHANMLSALYRKGQGVLDAAYARFKPQAVLLSIEFVKEKTAAARAGQLTPVQALALARELESALLETNFFKVAETAPSGLKPVLARLASETQHHLEMVSEALEAERR